MTEAATLAAALACHAGQPLCVRDSGGRVLFSNAAWHDARGNPTDADAKALADAERRAWATGEPQVTDGAARTRVTPLCDDDDNLLGVLCTVESDAPDAGALRRLVAREQELRADAERASRAKDAVLGALSHALRSALNTVRGWTDLLARTRPVDNGLLERAAGALARAVAQQAQLLDDATDAVRLLGDELTVEKHLLDVAGLVCRALETVHDAASIRKVELQFAPAAAADAEFFVVGDSARLQQVVRHLLTNAIRHTPEGGVVDVTLAGSRGEVTIEVRDTGTGISADCLPHVFDGFPRKVAAAGLPRSGLGIGLFLVRRLVDLHGGRVEAASDGAGRGAVFSVTLPRVH